MYHQLVPQLRLRPRETCRRLTAGGFNPKLGSPGSIGCETFPEARSTHERNSTIRESHSSEQITTITRQTNYGTWRFQKTWKPLHIADAEGCWFTDGAGKRYLDFSSQLMCVNLGHKNPRVIEPSPSRRVSLPIVAPGIRH